jgi:hypothetical protein
MARFIALDIIAFLLPFLAYWGFLSLSRHPRSHPKNWEARTLVILSIVGAVIILGSIVTMIHLGAGDGTGAHYRPAEMRDGRIVPGGFE